MVVHDIEMNHVGACGNDLANFVTQLCEVGGKDAGSDTVGSHEKKQIDRIQIIILYRLTSKEIWRVSNRRFC